MFFPFFPYPRGYPRDRNPRLRTRCPTPRGYPRGKNLPPWICAFTVGTYPPCYPLGNIPSPCGYPRYKFSPSDIHEEKSVLALLGARFFPRGYPRGKTYTSDSHKAMGDILWISRGGKKISVSSKSVDIDVLKMSKGYWKTLENQDISH